MPDKEIRAASLEYHRQFPPGKIAIQATKHLTNQRDLALAYTPGVAAACDEIVRDPAEARNLTARGNLVGVVTNGTAVLGLGAIGPLAAKPVMEGKAVLFKKFAGIDCFDIEIDERDPDKLVDIIAALEPTFGGINLEDIKAPECFYIEKKLPRADEDPGVPRRPARHGDHRRRRDHERPARRRQGAEGRQARLLRRRRCRARVPRSPRAARHTAAEHLGRRHRGRRLPRPHARRWTTTRRATRRRRRRASSPTSCRVPTSSSACRRRRCSKPEWLAQMADKPLILALANPEPEIMPDVAKAARPDAVIATGRSDFPNQVNNVLCFPFIFRGALDVGATTINEAMKLATVRAIADLAMAEQSDIVANAYGEQDLHFGPEYLIPKPFDPRLIVMIAPAVAKAAMDSGVATRPIADFAAYRERLMQFVYTLRPADEADLRRGQEGSPKRIVFAEGEDERVLRAVQVVVDEGLARPILIGRPAVIAAPGRALRLAHPARKRTSRSSIPSRIRVTATTGPSTTRSTERKGVSQQYAKIEMRRRLTLIGAMMIHMGEADGMLCGTFGTHALHLRLHRPGDRHCAAEARSTRR